MAFLHCSALTGRLSNAGGSGLGRAFADFGLMKSLVVSRDDLEELFFARVIANDTATSARLVKRKSAIVLYGDKCKL